MKRFFYVLLAVIFLGLFSYTAVDSAVISSSTLTQGPVNIFVNFESIPGESREEMHRGWVDAIGLSKIIARPSTTSTDLRTSGSANFNITVVKNIDKATPKLQLLCASGQYLRSVKIDLVRSTSAGPVIFMSYELNNVTVSSINVDVSSGGATETVTLGFSKIKTIYTEVDQRTGSPRGNIESVWDLAANRGS
jgi:type VI secretion system secreted protein Hcp